MKRFYALVTMEFAGLFVPLCILVGVMAVLELTLFWIAMWNVSAGATLAYLVDTSGVAAVFVMSLVALPALIILRFAQGFAPSKSIYALLTLPIKRERVYHSKLVAALIAGFCVVAMQLLLLLVLRQAFQTLYVPLNYMQDTFTADSSVLYLILLDSGVFRLLLPPDALSLLFSLSILCGGVCFAVSASALISAGRRVQAIVFAVVWILLVLVTFPLADHKLWHSIFKLIPLLIFPITVSIVGAGTFKTGEVAA